MALKHLPILVFLFFLGSEAAAAVFTLQNKCRETIWPAILTAAGKPQLMDGGVQLRPNQTIDIVAPKGWSGRLWGRPATAPLTHPATECVSPEIAEASSNAMEPGGMPPATLAKFTLDSPMDFYDVSLVDGYNMPVSIFPSGGSGTCKAIKCLKNLNLRCPKELKLKNKGRVVGCKSACLAFNKPEYCCSGEFNNPSECKLSNYSRAFKAACPLAYSYAYEL